MLGEVLESGRWAISAPYAGARSFERRFSDAFCLFNACRFCVPTSSGTTSLMVALEACGVGAGDEVIIPGLTWVANASAVAAVNAKPVLADIHPETLCMDPESVRARIGPRTKAITVVHLYSAVADLDALASIARQHGLVLIEDCAQVHGARYRDRTVGTFGAMGTFSMQATKVLTSGEGGAVITNDADLARRAEHLRADGRCYGRDTPAVGTMELVETADVMGHNYSLSEFQSAVLLAQLQMLPQQNEIRARNAALLDRLLTNCGLTPQLTSPGTTSRTYYQYAALLPPDMVAQADLGTIAAALRAELGLSIAGGYSPLNTNRLYDPHTRRRFTELAGQDLSIQGHSLPVTEDIIGRLLTFHHAGLLGDETDMNDIAEAVIKVADNLAALAKTELRV
ncbi:aminotransferase DegT [Rhizocola hellebori]|uniref:Aminotransferase DegT n=2 Tax=Rhizocola hellebori TaxID=1392758 RepID=A0A8J3VEM7_9ACTN|nr:aminotransferase DegT [Rhizocola hellebori]